jgi:enamine deaminase RidA (YjgF/YER057c/UK114 family)
MPFELLNPAGLELPVGYAHVAKITGGTIVHVAGQAPFNESGEVVGRGDFVAQFAQVIKNLKSAVQAVGGRTDQYAVLTMYVTDMQAYHDNTKIIGGIYREIFDKHFPAITLVEVKSLYNRDCMIEVSGMAVIG